MLQFVMFNDMSCKQQFKNSPIYESDKDSVTQNSNPVYGEHQQNT